MTQSHRYNVSARPRSFRRSWILFALLIAALLPGAAAPVHAAGPAALVKDINLISVRHTPPSGFSASSMITVGNRVFFQGYDINNGYELWRSDGTPSGTQIVRDTDPGLTPSSIYSMADVNGTLFFRKGTSTIWKSDGTAAGTVVVTSNQTGGPSDAGDFTNVNGTLFFTARVQAGHMNLWKSDGTAAGTVAVADLNPTGEGYISNLTAVGNKLFFIAFDVVHGHELWTSDGTTSGTVIVKDINPAGDSFDYGLFNSELTVVGDKLFFITTTSFPASGLWQSDGTAAGTTRVATTNPALQLSAVELENVNGTLFFSGSRNDPIHGLISGLWKTDGTQAGTTPVKDLATNALPLSSLKAIGSRLFFAGIGDKLWTSDGTASGTAQIGDVTVGGLSYLPSFTNVGGLAFFAGKDSGGDIELWKSDGTNGGTARVKDINTTGSSSPAYFAALGNTLLFAADNGQGSALWKSDGSAAGTTLVKDPARTANGIAISYPYSPPLSSESVAIDDKLFFMPHDGVTSPEQLWVSDGTADGTEPLPSSDAGPVNQYSLVEHNGKLFFFRMDALGTNLWQSDGTMAGTTIVRPFRRDRLGAGNHNLISVGNALFFFMSSDTGGYTLWKSDGSDAGTRTVADFPDTTNSYAPPSALTNVNSQLFFVVHKGYQDPQLWISDGTTTGTHVLKEISFEPFELTNVNGSLFFMALGDSGYELWKSDGSLAGTVRVKSLGYGPLNSPGHELPDPTNLTAVGAQLFFSAYTRDGGDELWVSDGSESGTRRVKDINAIPMLSAPFSTTHDSSPSSLANVNGSLLFSADDGVHGRELWHSDGTEAGTTLLKDLNPGPAGSGVNAIKQLPASVWALFAASDGPNGIELWKTTGTAAGTVQVQDISPGASSSNPTAFTASRSRCFFIADDGSTGPELWSLDPASLSATLNNKVHLPLLRR